MGISGESRTAVEPRERPKFFYFGVKSSGVEPIIMRTVTRANLSIVPRFKEEYPGRTTMRYHRLLILIAIVAGTVASFGQGRALPAGGELAFMDEPSAYSPNSGFKSGLEKLDRRDYAGAVADFSHAIETHPTFEELYFYRGMAKGYMGDDRGAVEDLTLAIKNGPGYYEAYLHRAITLYFMKDYRGTLADCSDALEINPKLAKAWRYRGKALIQLGDPAAAVRDLDRAIELKPDDAEAYYFRGFAKYALGETEAGCLDFGVAADLGNEEAAREKQRYCR